MISISKINRNNNFRKRIVERHSTRISSLKNHVSFTTVILKFQLLFAITLLLPNQTSKFATASQSKTWNAKKEYISKIRSCNENSPNWSNLEKLGKTDRSVKSHKRFNLLYDQCFHEDKFCDGEKDCLDGSDERGCLKKPDMSPAMSPAVIMKMTGGRPSKQSSWPYIARLEILNTKKNQFYHCGATIITDIWLITAAHCSMLGEKFLITVGEHDLGKKDSYEQKFLVEKIFSHEGFLMNDDLPHDIALVKLVDRIKFGRGTGLF